MNNNQGRRRTRRVRQQRKQKNTQISRILLTVCMIALVAVVSIGGTVAWLTAQTGEITNTFTTSDITITLAETANLDFQMVPGKDITKDPKVTVQANSEKAWVFVKVTENNWPTWKIVGDDNVATDVNKVNYTIDNGWTKLNDEGVYFRIVNKDEDNAQTFSVLTGDRVTVSTQVTKGELNGLTTNPTLAFVAYAIQYEGFEPATTDGAEPTAEQTKTAAEKAWKAIPKSVTP